MVARFDEEHGKKKSGGTVKKKNDKRGGENRSNGNMKPADDAVNVEADASGQSGDETAETK